MSDHSHDISIAHRGRDRSGLRHDGRSGRPPSIAPSIAATPYYFCSAGCRTKFTADPQKYLGGARRREPRRRRRDLHLPDASGDPPGRAPAPARSAAWRSNPKSPTADTGPNPELADMTRRFWIGLALSAAGVRARDGRRISSARTAGSIRRSRTGSSSRSRRRSCCGRAGRSSCAAGNRCVTRNLNMFTLIAMGTGVAYLYSVVATLAPGIFPAAFRDARRRRRGLFRGRRRDHRAGAARPGAGAARARGDLGRDPRAARSRAQDRAPRCATTAATRTSRSTPSPSATACACGRARRCRSTAIVIEGHSALDESMVTGESMPVTKDTGAQRHRRHAQQHRQLRDARRQGRPRHAAGADRADGGEAQRSARADPAAGRSGRRLVRAGGDRGGAARLRRLGDVRAGAALRLWPGRRGERADHRLPLRARPGHADVDHGRRRPRRARPAC